MKKAEDFEIKTIEIRRVGEDHAIEPYAKLTDVVLGFQYYFLVQRFRYLMLIAHCFFLELTFCEQLQIWHW